ncbi:MAG: NAD-dependent epimerase/dehydratase family protein [Acidimicrobiia bacterium]|nr:NAD-dependent epimerase/dehydratase family protein [Acidimicrobiia bacterium]
MKVFLTGATGYIGSAVLDRLQQKGHGVKALARSEESAQKLASWGAEICRGDLEHPGAWRQAAGACDAVVHTAMSWGTNSGVMDRAVVESVLDALDGTGKTFLYTSGVWVMGDTKGRLAGEMFPLKPASIVAWRPAVERLVLEAGDRRIRGIVVRPAMVYGRGGGAVHRLKSGELPLIGGGENHWSFVHVDDLADLYVLALENSGPGELYLAAHGAPQLWKDVALAAGCEKSLSLEEARKLLGPIAEALIIDQKVGSTKAARVLGWRPSRPQVLEELR